MSLRVSESNIRNSSVDVGCTQFKMTLIWMGVASSDSHGGVLGAVRALLVLSPPNMDGCVWSLEETIVWCFYISLRISFQWNYVLMNVYVVCVRACVCCCTLCCLDWWIQDICDSSCCFTWVRSLMQWPIPWTSIWISYMWCVQVQQSKT